VESKSVMPLQFNARITVHCKDYTGNLVVSVFTLSAQLSVDQPQGSRRTVIGGTKKFGSAS